MRPSPLRLLPAAALALVPAVLVASLPPPTGGAAVAGPAHCPPGLARQAVPCVPPGQARRAGWQVGAPLPAGVDYVIIRNPDRLSLPRTPHGTRYVRVDNHILRIAVETGRVIEAVANIARLLD
ncbi:MAG: RcnB family protein [Alkalilacustris sp.]